MAGIEDLPPDLRGEVGPKIALGMPAPREKPGGGSFIGGKAREYAPDPPRLAVPPITSTETEVKTEAETPKPAEACQRCEKKGEATASFCWNCGLDFKRKRAADTLGIEITSDEIDDYLFKGQLVKAIPLFGNHVATFKTVQAGELDLADELTATHFEGKKPVDLEWMNYRSKCLISFGWMKLDGKSLGDSPEKRLAWIQTAGSQLVELAGRKFNLLNLCLTEVLNSDVIKNS